jgi:alpha-N-acetylglucosamine transferase
MGYSLKQSNDLSKQNAEMVLFVRKHANVSMAVQEKLQKVGWKLRMEDDIAFENIDVEQILEHHRFNLNKIRFWSWVEYDQILFIDADTLVKGDLSEVWEMPGSIVAQLIPVNDSNCRRAGCMVLRRRRHQIQLRGTAPTSLPRRIQAPPTGAI